MKKFCLFLSMLLLFLTSPINKPGISAVEAVPIKVGLYYNSKAQSQINISADKGVAFNAYDAQANKYYSVFNSAAGEAVNIIKDGYFIKNGTVLTPSDVNSKPTMGPFHIQIQELYGSYNDAETAVKGYMEKGVPAYPVYTDSGWYIWTGFYISKAAAEGAIEGIKSKLGEQTYSVIDISATRIYGMNSSGDVLFMFASEKNLLRGKSLSTADPNPIMIGSSLYRGQVEFKRQTNSDMTIINILPFEEYLYGVVPNEIEAYSHVEALKAQTIAARTYSYKSINKHSSYGFNLCSTTDCQVYRGYSSESAATNKAVDATKNMVVTYNGALAETVFSASTGGKTEAAVNVWGFDVPYLQSVEDKYESGKSYMYNWNLTFTVDEISQKLKNYNVGNVTGIEITKYSQAGRPIELIVRGTSNSQGVVISKNGCRTFLSLYSQWYTMTTNADINISVNGQNAKTQLSQVKVITANGEAKFSDPNQSITIVSADGTRSSVSVSPTQYNFTGKGWGHAVGLSQEGAKGMANAGFTYDQILAHYYPGTKIGLKN